MCWYGREQQHRAYADVPGVVSKSSTIGSRRQQLALPARSTSGWASAAYKFVLGEAAASEVYFNIRNLTNKDPAIVAPGSRRVRV